MLESGVEGMLIRQLLDARAQRLHLDVASRSALDEGRADDVRNLGEVLRIETACREGGGTDAQARGDGRRTRVEGDGVAVDGDADLVQEILGLLAVELRLDEVNEDQVDVCAAG